MPNCHTTIYVNLKEHKNIKCQGNITMHHPHLMEGLFFAIGIDFFAVLFVKSEQPLAIIW